MPICGLVAMSPVQYGDGTNIPVYDNIRFQVFC